VIEDEPALAALVASYLTRDGFDVRRELDGPSGLAAITEHRPDVIVLDVALPGMDGIEVARRARIVTDAYIIMLTARAEEADVLIGLSVGADDYMTKPFSPRELTARVRTLLRRPRAVIGGGTMPGEPTMTFGSLTIDAAGREVAVAGRQVELTRTEFDLLAALASAPRRVFTRRALIEAAWGADWAADEHLVDVHLLHVRRKLGDTASEQRFIRTVRGVGYRLGTGDSADGGG
jgi:DNA-binding response OmpR family regulator